MAAYFIRLTKIFFFMFGWTKMDAVIREGNLNRRISLNVESFLCVRFAFFICVFLFFYLSSFTHLHLSHPIFVPVSLYSIPTSLLLFTPYLSHFLLTPKYLPRFLSTPVRFPLPWRRLCRPLILLVRLPRLLCRLQFVGGGRGAGGGE